MSYTFMVTAGMTPSFLLNLLQDTTAFPHLRDPAKVNPDKMSSRVPDE
jgi:hypothetical protein